VTVEKVFVTGVHKGLGHALAACCLNDGALVFGVSREPPQDLIEHPNFNFGQLDLRCFEKIPSAIEALLPKAATLDLILLNAGVLGELKDLRNTSIDELRAVMDLNVWANKVMVDSLIGGRHEVRQVVAISSGAAVNGSAGWGAYSISKSALNLLVRVLGHEHPQTHFTALAPGIVETDMIRAILALPENPHHEANNRIRAAVEEGQTFSAAAAASAIRRRLPELLKVPSGSFIDIRKM
jgi:benzil reductase ((S)-benzoin forming)